MNMKRSQIFSIQDLRTAAESDPQTITFITRASLEQSRQGKRWLRAFDHAGGITLAERKTQRVPVAVPVAPAPAPATHTRGDEWILNQY